MKNLLLILFLFIYTFSFAQTKENDNKQQLPQKKSEFWKNVRFGGNFALSLGSNNTTIGVNPTAVYDFNDSFSLGSSLGYTYSKNGDLKSNVYSGSILSIYNPSQLIAISAELEQLFVKQNFNSISQDFNYPALYLGVAYRTRNISVGGRFDVLHDDDKSIYSSPFTPFVRVFF